MANQKSMAPKTNKDGELKRRTWKQGNQQQFEALSYRDHSVSHFSETPYHPQMESHASLLSGANSLKEKANLILSLQQSYGNQYVQSLLAFARTHNMSTKAESITPEVQRQAASQGTVEAVEDVERRAIERADLLIGQTYGQNFFRGFREGVMAAYARSNWQVLEEYEAKQTWIAQHGSDPNSLNEYKKVNAWVDRSTEPPTIYFRRDRGDFGTFVHEGLHFYSDKVLDRVYGDNVDEGVTEYFTRIITDAAGYTRNSYNLQVEEVRALVQLVGEDALRSAYFGGQIEALEFRGTLGDFSDWAGYMKAQRYSDARQVVTARPIVRFGSATEPTSS